MNVKKLKINGNSLFFMRFKYIESEKKTKKLNNKNVRTRNLNVQYEGLRQKIWKDVQLDLRISIRGCLELKSMIKFHLNARFKGVPAYIKFQFSQQTMSENRSQPFLKFHKNNKSEQKRKSSIINKHFCIIINIVERISRSFTILSSLQNILLYKHTSCTSLYHNSNTQSQSVFCNNTRKYSNE